MSVFDNWRQLFKTEEERISELKYKCRSMVRGVDRNLARTKADVDRTFQACVDAKRKNDTLAYNTYKRQHVAHKKFLQDNMRKKLLAEIQLQMIEDLAVNVSFKSALAAVGGVLKDVISPEDFAKMQEQMEQAMDKAKDQEELISQFLDSSVRMVDRELEGLGNVADDDFDRMVEQEAANEVRAGSDQKEREISGAYNKIEEIRKRLG